MGDYTNNSNSRKLFSFCIRGLHVIAYIKNLEMSVQLQHTIASLADFCFYNLDFLAIIQCYIVCIVNDLVFGLFFYLQGNDPAQAL